MTCNFQKHLHIHFISKFKTEFWNGNTSLLRNYMRNSKLVKILFYWETIWEIVSWQKYFFLNPHFDFYLSCSLVHQFHEYFMSQEQNIFFCYKQTNKQTLEKQTNVYFLLYKQLQSVIGCIRGTFWSILGPLANIKGKSTMHFQANQGYFLTMWGHFRATQGHFQAI